MARLDENELMELIEQDSNPVSSAADLATELGFSRQYISRTLRNLEDRGFVERVEIGPSVAWYVPDSWETMIEQQFEGKSFGKTPVIICNFCNEKIELQEEAIVVFEKLSASGSWDVLDAICADHGKGKIEFADLSGQQELISEGVKKFDTTFAFVKGEIQETEMELEDGRSRKYLILSNVRVRELIRA